MVERKFLYVLRFQNADSYLNNFNDRLNSALSRILFGLLRRGSESHASKEILEI